MDEGWLDTPLPLAGKRVWVAGHEGMVGAALCRRLKEENCGILTVPRAMLDLRNQDAARRWMAENRPDIVVLAAAKVGGIYANSVYCADFLYDNLMIAANVLHAAHESGVKKLLFLGSSCIYPKLAPQPIREEALLDGALEPTNEPYALAKIAGLKLAQSYRRQHGCDFISAMPCNLYGPGDRYDAEGSHVIPALIMKAHAAKMQGAEALTVWGSGKPLREFLYVDDLADGLVFLLKSYSGESHINIGSGEEIAIAALVQKIADVAGFEGEIVFDVGKPDGTPRKLMDCSRMRRRGWRPVMALDKGLRQSYADFCMKMTGIC